MKIYFRGVFSHTRHDSTLNIFRHPFKHVNFIEKLFSQPQGENAFSSVRLPLHDRRIHTELRNIFSLHHDEKLNPTESVVAVFLRK